MKRLSLIASALAVLGLTACEKGLVEDIADVSATSQVTNSVLQVRTRSGGMAGSEATVAYPVTVYVFQDKDCRAEQTIGDSNQSFSRRNIWRLGIKDVLLPMDGEFKEEDAMERKGNHAHRGTPEILCEILRYEIFRIYFKYYLVLSDESVIFVRKKKM